MSAVDEEYLETRPKGTIIRVIDTGGHHFDLVAEHGAFRDFILHKGTAPRNLEGRVSKAGRPRTFWSTAMLARWVAEGICTIKPMGDSK